MNSCDSKNMIICGVGGQGIVLLGKILGEFYLDKGYNLKVADIVGLGQRGGSVLCHFRYSDKPILSPLIKAGDVDCIISFEQTETLRNLHFLKEKGVIFTSTFEMSSPTVNVGIERDIKGDKTELIKEAGKETFIIDISKHINSGINLSQAINIVMLAFFASYMGYNDDEIIRVMKENINSKFIESNIRAYEFGKQLYTEQTIQR